MYLNRFSSRIIKAVKWEDLFRVPEIQKSMFAFAAADARTASGVRSVSRFCYKFSWQFHWLVDWHYSYSAARQERNCKRNYWKNKHRTSRTDLMPGAAVAGENLKQDSRNLLDIFAPQININKTNFWQIFTCWIRPIPLSTRSSKKYFPAVTRNRSAITFTGSSTLMEMDTSTLRYLHTLFYAKPAKHIRVG